MEPRSADEASAGEGRERTATGRLGRLASWAAGLLALAFCALFAWRASAVSKPLPQDANHSNLYKRALERALDDSRKSPARRAKIHRHRPADKDKPRVQQHTEVDHPSSPRPAPEAHASLLDRGKQLFDDKQYAEALKVFLQAARTNPDDYLAHCRCGDAYLRLGMAPQAIASYRKGYQLNPRFTIALHGVAQAYLALEKPEEAIQAYEQALQARPDDQAAAKAIRALRQSREIPPED